MYELPNRPGVFASGGVWEDWANDGGDRDSQIENASGSSRSIHCKLYLVAAFGAVIERLLLRRLAGLAQAQVLVTLGIAFMIADFCLMVWTGDPITVPTPPELAGVWRAGGIVFSIYRMAIILIACAFAAILWLMLERTRLGAMIRASVDDPQMTRVVGIRVSRLFTLVFSPLEDPW